MDWVTAGAGARAGSAGSSSDLSRDRLVVGATVLAGRTEKMLKTLKHARLDNSYEAEFRKLVAVDPLILDDFAIDILDPVESRDLYDLLLERYRPASVWGRRGVFPPCQAVAAAPPLRHNHARRSCGTCGE